MKKSEVPQDESPISKHGSNELLYALDDDGKIKPVQSIGWEVKSVVQYQNLESLNQRVLDALQQVKEGKSSPILYVMELNKMDWNTLAAYMGSWVCWIKSHQKPKVFQKLNNKVLSKYAESFGFTLEELKTF